MIKSNTCGNPFFSIVIANFNYGRFLEEAIQSVLNQSYKNFELIVVDGGSTDNSIDVIKKYEGSLAWWCSEKDRGQGHAFNKGFGHAKGKLLTWLNSDDVMFPNSLCKVYKKALTFKSDDEIWIVGGCMWLTPDLHIIKFSRARSFSNIWASWNIVSVWGPSSFFSKELLEKAGWIDERFHYMLDTELWLRFFRKMNVKYRKVNGYCWGLRLHPDAKMSGHNFTESPLANLDHPSWDQKDKENDMIIELYGFNNRPSFIRVFSLFSMPFLLSLFETTLLKIWPSVIYSKYKISSK